MRDQKPKYIVPEQVKDRVKAFMNDFMEANNLTKKGLAELMQDKLGRRQAYSRLAYLDRLRDQFVRLQH